jgi:hypothetical protein
MKLGFVSAILPELTLDEVLSGRQAALRVAGKVLRPFFGNSTRPVSNPA